MHVPELSLPMFVAVLAYGPVPGVELIPYFLGLVAWVGLAFSAFLLAPIRALLRRLRRGRGAAEPAPTSEPTPPELKSSADGNHDLTV